MGTVSSLLLDIGLDDVRSRPYAIATMVFTMYFALCLNDISVVFPALAAFESSSMFLLCLILALLPIVTTFSYVNSLNFKSTTSKIWYLPALAGIVMAHVYIVIFIRDVPEVQKQLTLGIAGVLSALPLDISFALLFFSRTNSDTFTSRRAARLKELQEEADLEEAENKEEEDKKAPGFMDKMKACISRAREQSGKDGKPAAFIPSIMYIAFLTNMGLALVLTVTLTYTDTPAALNDYGDSLYASASQLTGGSLAAQVALVEQVEGTVSNIGDLLEAIAFELSANNLTVPAGLYDAIEGVDNATELLSLTTEAMTPSAQAEDISALLDNLGDIMHEWANVYPWALIFTMIVSLSLHIYTQLSHLANYPLYLDKMQKEGKVHHGMSPWLNQSFAASKVPYYLGNQISNFATSFVLWFVVLILTFLLLFWVRTYTVIIANPAIYGWIITFCISFGIKMAINSYYVPKKLVDKDNKFISRSGYRAFAMFFSIYGLITGALTAIMRVCYLWGFSLLAMLRLDVTFFPTLFASMDTSWLSYMAILRMHHSQHDYFMNGTDTLMANAADDGDKDENADNDAVPMSEKDQASDAVELDAEAQEGAD